MRIRAIAAVAACGIILGCGGGDTGPSGPGPAAKLVVVAGDNQSGTVGTPVPIALAIRVTDAASRPVPGALVSFSVGSGGGQVGAASVTSDASGMVSTTWTLGTAAGADQSVVASISGGTVTLHATARADVPSALQLRAAPSSSLRSGDTFAQPIAVALVDRYGNAAAVAGVAVTAALDLSAASARSLRGATTANTDASGIATFAALGVAGPIGESTLSFFAAGLTSVTSKVTLTTGVAKRLEAVAGTSITAKPNEAASVTVRVADESGNPVAGVNVDFLYGPGNVPLRVASDSLGLARFSGIAYPSSAGVYQLTASAGGLASLVFSITVTSGAPTKLTLLSSSAVTGVCLTTGPAVSVLVRDAAGNVVRGERVSFAISGTALADVNTDDAGVATLQTWKLPAKVARYSLTATVAGLDPIATQVDVTVGALSDITSTSPAGVTLSSTTRLSVRLTDAGGNPIARVSTTWSLISGGGTLDFPLNATDDDGVAKANLTVGTNASTNTIRVTSGGHQLTFTVAVQTSPPVGISTMFLPQNQRAGSIAFVTFRVVDKFGNGVPGVTVSFRGDGVNTLPFSPSPAVSDASGNVNVTASLANVAGRQPYLVDGPGFSAEIDLYATNSVGSIVPAFVGAWSGSQRGPSSSECAMYAYKADGTPDAGHTVTATLLNGGTFIGATNGTFTATTATGHADASGRILFDFFVPTTPGTYGITMTSALPNITNSPATCRVTMLP